MSDTDKYPHVSDRQKQLIDEYGDLLVNTGGNDPADLLNDLNNPRRANMVRTNFPRFTLAVAVQSQLAFIYNARSAGLVQKRVKPWSDTQSLIDTLNKLRLAYLLHPDAAIELGCLVSVGTPTYSGAGLTVSKTYDGVLSVMLLEGDKQMFNVITGTPEQFSYLAHVKDNRDYTPVLDVAVQKLKDHNE